MWLRVRHELNEGNELDALSNSELLVGKREEPMHC